MGRLRFWLARKMLSGISHIDYSLKVGDEVFLEGWAYSKLTVVDMNWALLAVAVKLGNGGIVVWPVWSVQKHNPNE